MPPWRRTMLRRVDSELWERLLSGHCARVAILSPITNRSMVELYFPQTLGLPPLWCRWMHDSPEVIAANATALAATDRWIAEGPVWIEHFLPRAEAIISVETRRVTMRANMAAASQISLTEATKRMGRAAARRRSAASDENVFSSGFSLALDSPPLTRSSTMRPATLTSRSRSFPRSWFGCRRWARSVPCGKSARRADPDGGEPAEHTPVPRMEADPCPADVGPKPHMSFESSTSQLMNLREPAIAPNFSENSVVSARALFFIASS